jgi:hypothetical protein
VPAAHQTTAPVRTHPAQIGVPKKAPKFLGPPPEIVVKFKDAKVSEICDMYWKNKDGARERFAQFADKTPGLEGLRLKRVTYSNEVVLDFGDGLEQNRDAIKSKFGNAVKSLRGLSSVSYAEPNSTAHPGK